MLLGLILRGVAFDFRMKRAAVRKGWWNGAFMPVADRGARAGVMLAATSRVSAGPGMGIRLVRPGIEPCRGYTLLGRAGCS